MGGAIESQETLPLRYRVQGGIVVAEDERAGGEGSETWFKVDDDGCLDRTDVAKSNKSSSARQGWLRPAARFQKQGKVADTLHCHNRASLSAYRTRTLVSGRDPTTPTHF